MGDLRQRSKEATLSKSTVVISAAGIGRRMKTKGPKALIGLGSGETVLSRQLLLTQASFPSAKIVVVVGHCAEKIISVLPKDVHYVVNEDYERTNVARSFLLGIEAFPCDRAILLCGDLVFGKNFLNCLTKTGSIISVDARPNHRQGEVGINVDNGNAVHFTYGAFPRWAQAVALEGVELELYRNIAAQDRCARWFAYEVLNAIIDQDGRFAVAHPSRMSLVEIDQIQDVIRARRLASGSRRKGVAK